MKSDQISLALLAFLCVVIGVALQDYVKFAAAMLIGVVAHFLATKMVAVLMGEKDAK